MSLYMKQGDSKNQCSNNRELFPSFLSNFLEHEVNRVEVNHSEYSIVSGSLSLILLVNAPMISNDLEEGDLEESDLLEGGFEEQQYKCS